jgi:hypothetical protein
MKLRAHFVILAVSLSTPAMAELLTGVDETAKLPFWEWRNDYLTLRLVQRLPDQTRAYFAGRGFATEHVSYIASHCFFQTVFTNTTGVKNKRVIEHDIRDWEYRYNSKSMQILPREDWKVTWQQRNVKQAQMIAFEWSLFPSQQVFEAGDYNWGMTVFNVPHGKSFDLDIAWKVDGKPQSATLNGITCAKDIYLPPQ